MPKSLYMTEDDVEKERQMEDAAFALNSVYHTADVQREHQHEVRGVRG